MPPIGTPISLSLADSNPLVLSAMSERFERDPRFSLVSTSATAEGFLGMVMRVPVQVGVIDWNLPVLGGQKLIEVIREQPGAPRLVVYGDDPKGELPRRAMMAGAAGFVSRTIAVETLLETCLSVAAGQMVFPFLDVRVLQNDPIQSLTPRERTLLEALAKGLTNAKLAEELGILGQHREVPPLEPLRQARGDQPRRRYRVLLPTSLSRGRGPQTT